MSVVRQTFLMGDDERKSYKSVFSTRYTTTMGIAFGRQTTKFDIPIHDTRAMLDRNVKRHADDVRFVGEFDDTEDARFFKYTPVFDDRDVCPKDPSYTKFKCPMEINCKERLKKDTVRYNNQLKNEISKLIDYQKNALEAAYFVKVMSYTTLWPPYHSYVEIANTSRTFYRLSKKEQARYDFIMSHDFS
ncbi:uncharacterized protein LOC6727084 [Drosophila simulans]|uniref:uncharacterized protein LOC6727084 n=1 Tax=Drosophila simulans TaxID=7240 RepID=UPI00078AE97F|nr:uncharacterized protein LOC6727084 [Drosophila simulans]KMZ02015.1 uncharacterized protein Dsimw501_GD19934 [Drosophila simulans]